MDAEKLDYIESLIPSWAPREYGNHWQAERKGEVDPRRFRSRSACWQWCKALNAGEGE